MLISISPILLFLSSTIAAPSSENQLSFTAESLQVGLASTVHQFTSSLISSIGFNSLLSSFSANEYGLQTKDESKTLWKVINENDHFTQLAHVLNYSSDATKKMLDDEEARITLLAPINWYKKPEKNGLVGEESTLGDNQEASALIELSLLESQIQDFESFSASSSDDDDKERRRRMIAHIIDAVLSYHIVDSQQLLDYNEISRNSSIATKLNLGQYQHKKLALESLSTVHEADFPNLNDGQAWRVRVGKSLLPRPAVYLNFYSRVVSADHVVKNGQLHAISAPLLPPSSVLQSLFFATPDFASVTTALQKTGGAGYLGFPHMQHNQSSTSQYEHPGTTALTFFAPGNSAWYKLPVKLRLFLFSPWGTKFLAKILMLHALPLDIVYADSVHHVQAHKAFQVETYQTSEILEAFGPSNITRYTFKSALPKLNCSESHFKSGVEKMEFEEVDVEVARYYLLPGGRGPLQTRMSVQGVPVLLQDIPSANGVWHTITSFIKPKGHGKEGLWGAIALEAEEKGFGKIDLESF